MDLSEVAFPDGIEIRPLSEYSNDEIWECYNETFLSSGDHRYLEQTELQRRENFELDFFNREKLIDEKASILLLDAEKIIGFMKINLWEDGTGYCNGIGIHPDYRGRGLGRAILTASLLRAAQNGVSRAILEVDIENEHAIVLYKSVGFRQTKGSISHIWRASK